MFVKVAIDLALDRLFTYEVPAALQEKLVIGQLLSVPFGHREARGFAIEVAESPGEKPTYAIKSVLGIVDEAPFFSAKLLKLVRLISDYTAAPFESVLKAALPAAVVKRNMHPREMMFIEPMLCPAPVEMTPRLKWLYDQIVRLGGGWMGQLCRELGTTGASLRQLGQRGLVRISVRERRRDPLANRRILPSAPLWLNDGQRVALERIVGSQGKPVLLHGVTGSGKTEVYLQAIAAELAAGRGAIVMVPEIALTPQTVQRFASRFGSRVAVLHSALSDGERYDEWHRIRAGAARVVVGPRSAVWAPVADLGLIVVDEEHDPSYKQDESPRYNARDTAVLRAAVEGAKVVLGSATPSLESWLNAERGKYERVEMRARAGAGTMPGIRLVDMVGDDAAQTKGRIFSDDLLSAIGLRLDRGEQTMLFLNRRGYARAAICEACGTALACEACGVSYTYHQADACLRCHICGRWIAVPRNCPGCGFDHFDFRGIGTQRVEAALKKCFPRARVLRMDADSTSRKNSHDDILSAFRRGEADILLGTQMIVKGLDFPNVTLVGVLNADSSLNLPDFRAAERTYQLLAQVAGRAGRAELPGEVLVQSHDPESPVLKAVVRGDFARFAEDELACRRECGFPPYSHLAVIGLRSKDPKLAGDWADLYAKSIMKLAARAGGAELKVSAAMPAPLEKADGWYRWQVVLRASRASTLVKAWRWISGERPVPDAIRISIDIDAINLV